MKEYTMVTQVIRATGYQTWTVNAETEEEALAAFDRGECEFVDEEIEVDDMGEPEITEIYDLDEKGNT